MYTSLSYPAALLDWLITLTIFDNILLEKNAGSKSGGYVDTNRVVGSPLMVCQALVVQLWDKRIRAFETFEKWLGSGRASRATLTFNHRNRIGNRNVGHSISEKGNIHIPTPE